MPEQRNLIIALLLSALILGGFHFLYEKPKLEHMKQLAEVERQDTPSHQVAGRADSPAANVSALTEEPVQPRSDVIAAQSRLKIENPRLYGSLSLQGIRFEDLTFKDYFTAVDHQTHVDLLSPTDTEAPYFAALGWSPASGDGGIALPGDRTKWTLAAGSSRTLSQTTPVTLTWDNGQGLVFTRKVALDANYMFTVSDSVTNNGKSALSLAHYASITRQGLPQPAKRIGDAGLENLVGVFDGHMSYESYAKLEKDKLSPDEQVRTSTGGWVGASDKYWLVAVIPDQSEAITAEFRHSMKGRLDVFQADYASAPKPLAVGASLTETTRMFAGAKQVELLKAYRDDLNIPKFDLAVDWGFFPFLTKPFFYAIDYLAKAIGNFGLGILALTICVRILLLPLSWKTFRTMNRLSELSPQMVTMKEKHGSNKEAMQKELMELYQKEGVNPISGCLPQLMQIPIFISLYKVLSTTIEMRQQPFFWYVHDLSAPDPTNMFNLFGLIPTIAILPHLGFLAIVLGLTLLALQLNSPKPTDPAVAKMMLLNPLIFTFMMGQAPVGLIIYYIFSNTITIIQTRVIRRVYKARYRPEPAPVG